MPYSNEISRKRLQVFQLGEVSNFISGDTVSVRSIGDSFDFADKINPAWRPIQSHGSKQRRKVLLFRSIEIEFTSFGLICLDVLENEFSSFGDDCQFLELWVWPKLEPV